jgi:hypothetical protein
MVKHLAVYSALSVALLLLGCSSRVDPHAILGGVWNAGPQKTALFNYRCDNELYGRTPTFLSFEMKTQRRPKLWFDEGAYEIRTVSGSYPVFDLSLEREKDELVGNLPPKIMKGHARVHFMSEDKLWVEIVRDSQTDSEFDSSIGTGADGPDFIYWRAARLSKPLPSLH